MTNQAAVRTFPAHASRVRAAMVPFPAAREFLGLSDGVARRRVEDGEDGMSFLRFGGHSVAVVKLGERTWRVPVADLARVSGLSVNEVMDALSGEARGLRRGRRSGRATS